MLAIQRLGQNASRTSFASTTRSGKKIGMGNAATGKRVCQRLLHRLLSH